VFEDAKRAGSPVGRKGAVWRLDRTGPLRPRGASLSDSSPRGSANGGVDFVRAESHCLLLTGLSAVAVGNALVPANLEKDREDAR